MEKIEKVNGEKNRRNGEAHKMLKIKRVSALSLSIMLLMSGISSFARSTDYGKIVFHSDRDGNWEIYVFEVDKGTQVNLTNNPAHDCNPAILLFCKLNKAIWNSYR